MTTLGWVDRFRLEAAKVPWATLEHAEGSAVGTPDLLLALWQNDPDRVVAAYTHLWSALVGRRQVWSATAPAATLLALAVRDERFGGTDPTLRPGVLAFFREIAMLTRANGGGVQEAVVADGGVRPPLWTLHPQVACVSIVPTLFECAMELLGESDERTASMAGVSAVALSAWVSDAAAVERLRTWLNRAATVGDIHYRATAIVGLGELGGDTSPWLVSDYPGERMAAAIAPRLRSSAEATDQLVDLSLSPRALDYIFAPMLEPEVVLLPQFDGRRCVEIIASELCDRVTDPHALVPSAMATTSVLSTRAGVNALDAYVARIFADWTADRADASPDSLRLVDTIREKLAQPATGNVRRMLEALTPVEPVESQGPHTKPVREPSVFELSREIEDSLPTSAILGRILLTVSTNSLQLHYDGDDLPLIRYGKLDLDALPKLFGRAFRKAVNLAFRASIRLWMDQELRLEIVDALVMGRPESVGPTTDAGWAVHFEFDQSA